MCDLPAKAVGELRIDELAPADLTPFLRFYCSLADHIVRTFRPYGWDITAALLADGPLARLAAGDELALVYRDEAGDIWGHAFLQGTLAGGATFGIGVHQSLLGKGLGRRLMSAILQAAERKLQLKEIRLIAVQDNAPAVELYKSQGFEITGEFVSEDDGLPYYNMRKICRRRD